MGLFKAEIVPVKTTVLDNEGNQKTITVHQDEGVRPSTTLEGLAKLKPAFKENGSTTAGQLCCWVAVVPLACLLSHTVCSGRGGAHRFLPTGNASQVSDGAAAVLLAKRSKAMQLGLPILGVLRSFAVVGVPPDVMGIGPAYAIPVAVQKAGKEPVITHAVFSPGLSQTLRVKAEVILLAAVSQRNSLHSFHSLERDPA